MRRIALLACLVLAGCQLGLYRSVENPGTSQVMRVASGDRVCFDLPTEKGCAWRATSDDADVTVAVHPHGETSAVEIRVHRGYDGPTQVRFRQVDARTGRQVSTFTLSFYKRTGDAAFWK